MEVALRMPSSPPLDFDFHSTAYSPGSTSPSSPQPFRSQIMFLSAPTSPSQSPQLSDFDQSSADADDFAFHVGEGVKSPSASAEELFDGGTIRSLNAPAHSDSSGRKLDSPQESKPKENRSFWSQFTSRKKKQSNPGPGSATEKSEQARGRNMESASRIKGARSVSPIRVSKYPWEEEKKAAESNRAWSSRRWRLRDLLLFRSASEGRAADSRDPLRKMPVAYSRQRETKSSGLGSVSKRGPVSAHEKHYVMKKAVSEDINRKTFLPYKQGIIGSFYGFGG